MDIQENLMSYIKKTLVIILRKILDYLWEFIKAIKKNL